MHTSHSRSERTRDDDIELSCEDGIDNLAVDVGQSILTALIPERESRVVNAAQVKDRRLHIMNMDWVFGNVPSKIVGRSVHVASLDASTGQPPTEGFAEVIAPGRFRGVSLPEGSTSEFTAPYNQCIFQHSAFFQVLDQRGRGRLRVDALLFELRKQVGMLIPPECIS